MKDELSNIIKDSFVEMQNKHYKSAIEILYPKLLDFPNNIEIITQIAQCYYLMGEKEQAVEYYEKAFDINNHSTLVLDPLIELKIEQENYNEAERYADFYLQCEDRVYATQKYLETLIAIRKCEEIEEFSNNIDLQILNSISCCVITEAILNNITTSELSEAERLSKIDKAFSFAQHAYEQDKNHVESICAIAKCYIEKEEYEKIEELFRNNPQCANSPEFLSIYGFMAYNMGKYDIASDFYAKATDLDNQNEILFYNLAEAYMQQGWLDEAEVTIKKAIALNENNINCRLSLANIYYMKNDFDKTLLTLSFVDELEPDNIQMNLLYAYTYAHQNNFEKANLYAQKLQDKIDSSFIDSNFASIYYQLGRKDNAYEAIDKAIKKEPHNISFLDIKADFLAKDEKENDAIAIYDEILKLNPNYVDAYYQKAKIYLYNQNNDNALEYAKKAVEYDCNNAKYQFLLAEIYATLNDYPKAIDCAKIAISLTPDDIEKYHFIGYTYLEQNDIGSALAYYREIVNIAPNNFGELSSIAYSLSKFNFVKEALDYYQKAFQLNPYYYDFIIEFSDFVIEKISAFKGIKILLNFVKYTQNNNLKIEAKNRAKRLTKDNKSRLTLKEKIQLTFN